MVIVQPTTMPEPGLFPSPGVKHCSTQGLAGYSEIFSSVFQNGKILLCNLKNTRFGCFFLIFDLLCFNKVESDQSEQCNVIRLQLQDLV